MAVRSHQYTPHEIITVAAAIICAENNLGLRPRKHANARKYFARNICRILHRFRLRGGLIVALRNNGDIYTRSDFETC
ncbi:hypothetical protein NC653_019128 [Populus alba x Populus x berolinensis]|uniref:Uncharacterized protein n=1 Tax=Populus alba x Populus x berolinensis TaxID=444605 RepID=A0AAD6QI23_9ROSI|nr:hypothetical protein NC653_019128 [Populus alba x Populus x berolinensis]